MSSSSILAYTTVADVDSWDFQGGKVCVYCDTELQSWSRFGKDLPHPALQNAKTGECPNCGWWYVTNGWDSCNTLHWSGTMGVLEAFDLAAGHVPLEVLRAELPRHLDKMGTLNPNRMEDYVEQILKGVYDCEVKQLGYTRDGGIDLIVLDGDRPIAVQVKRRANLTSTERVGVIREFLGASMLAGHQRLLFVTTSKKFSPEAVKAARTAVKMSFVTAFELIDLDRFKSMISDQPRVSNIDIAFRRTQRMKRKNPQVPDPFEGNIFAA